ncbi:MAG: hypothetical protein JWQ88_3015 [Rhodoferax sp.]|nr:hypothetical protein [Rhodoferax sp.]
MKTVCMLILTSVVAAASLPTQAQGTVYRCGNEYTNNVRDAKDAQARGCKLVEGGNVTIIQTPRQGGTVGNSAGPVRAPTAAPPSDNADQRARDSDTRMILETELRKAEARQAELLREYNNGEPEKMGIESRNYQKYLDRVAELKASIARNDSDIAGIKREIARLPSR